MRDAITDPPAPPTTTVGEAHSDTVSRTPTGTSA
jgi:hypothetical protein